MFLTSVKSGKIGVFGHRFSQDGSSACLISLSPLDVTFDFLTAGDTPRRRARTSECFESFESSQETFQRLPDLL